MLWYSFDYGKNSQVIQKLLVLFAINLLTDEFNRHRHYSCQLTRRYYGITAVQVSWLSHETELGFWWRLKFPGRWQWVWIMRWRPGRQLRRRQWQRLMCQNYSLFFSSFFYKRCFNIQIRCWKKDHQVLYLMNNLWIIWFDYLILM